MKSLFYQGGVFYMGIVTILFVITIAWFVYHFIVAYSSKEIDKEKKLRLFEYGKSLGLITLIVGIIGQMVGLSAMFFTIEEVLLKGEEVIPALIYGAIKVTMIVPIYGLIVYLISILLWFVSSMIIEKKLN